MALDKSLKSAKRFGARYGKSLKQKVAKIEAEQRKKHKCPFCSAVAVRRVAAGIWNCKKCDSKFTGKAYTIPKKIIITQEVSKEEIVQMEKEVKTEKKKEEKPQKYKDNVEKQEKAAWDQDESTSAKNEKKKGEVE
jgi:large subunit ribosomal protein L37Ae